MTLPNCSTVHCAPVAATLTAFLAASMPATAQVGGGEILLNHFTHIDTLRHYRADGTLVTETSAATGSGLIGAAITSDGTWVTSYRTPVPAIGIFDPTGVEVSTFPTALTGANGDVSLFADGTIAASDLDGGVLLYSQAGVLLGAISTPGMTQSFGSGIDLDDDLWVCSVDGERIHHFTRDGTLLGVIGTTGFTPGDIDFAADGSLWVIGTGGNVRHYTRAGAIISSFQTGSVGITWGIAVDTNGSLWVSEFLSNRLLNFDPSGVMLGEFPVPVRAVFIEIPLGVNGLTYCSPSVPNSTGFGATMSATGSAVVSANDVTLIAMGVPSNSFGVFLTSRHQGFIPNPAGSQGILCLSGQVGRYVGPGQIQGSGQSTEFALSIDLTQMPTPGGFVPVNVGESWNFTAWYRDSVGGTATSNFADGLEILFL